MKSRILKDLRQLETLLFPLLFAVGLLAVVAISSHLATLHTFWSRVPGVDTERLEQTTVVLWIALVMGIVGMSFYTWVGWHRTRGKAQAGALRLGAILNGWAAFLVLAVVLGALAGTWGLADMDAVGVPLGVTVLASLCAGAIAGRLGQSNPFLNALACGAVIAIGVLVFEGRGATAVVAFAGTAVSGSILATLPIKTT